MKRELQRLAAVLRQIAYDAGCTLLGRGSRDSIRQCTAQYNRIHARITELDPDIAALFGPLPDHATAGQVRIAARALAAYIREQAVEEREYAWGGCLAFFLPGCSLKMDFC